MTPTTGAATPRTRRPRLMLLGCCLALFIISRDATIVNIALPAIQAELHASVSGLQWIIDSHTLVTACLLLLGGSIGDRIGARPPRPYGPGARRKMFQAGLVIFAAGSLTCCVAPDLGPLGVPDVRRPRRTAFGGWCRQAPDNLAQEAGLPLGGRRSTFPAGQARTLDRNRPH